MKFVCKYRYDNVGQTECILLMQILFVFRLVSQCLKTNSELQTPRHMAVLIWLNFKLVSYLLWKDELSQGLPAWLCGEHRGCWERMMEHLCKPQVSCSMF